MSPLSSGIGWLNPRARAIVRYPTGRGVLVDEDMSRTSPKFVVRDPVLVAGDAPLDGFCAVMRESEPRAYGSGLAVESDVGS